MGVAWDLDAITVIFHIYQRVSSSSGDFLARDVRGVDF
jgi:hypothetical protein